MVKPITLTQTENNCESTNRMAVTASLINSLPANDYDFSICDDLNDGAEYVKLEDFNSYLISNTANYNFGYYQSLSDAENEVTSNKITTAFNYKLTLGENKIYRPNQFKLALLWNSSFENFSFFKTNYSYSGYCAYL